MCAGELYEQVGLTSNTNWEALFPMTVKDLDDRLLNVFKDCPYKGKREDCTFAEMHEMEIDDRLDFLEKIDEDEKVVKWQKHLECYMNAIAR